MRLTIPPSLLTIIFICFASLAGAAVDIHPPVNIQPNVAWDRLRPLDHNPALDSGEALNRACVPGETVVLRKDIAPGSRETLAPRKGGFIVCIANRGDELELVDGPGNRWRVARGDVNATRGFPANWLAFDRDFLVWAYDRNTIIFRESLRNSFEGNFFYLLLDPDDKPGAAALLIDSGTGYADPAPYVMPAVGTRKLYITSTHSHWDHIGGHRHFISNTKARFAGYTPGPVYDPAPPAATAELKDFFQLTDWPDGSARFSLGTRELLIVPAPGHTADAMAVYDTATGLLFTGDTVCPGMLFVENWPQGIASLERLEQFARQHPVKWLLGGHIEMANANEWNGKYQYFHFGSNTHWNEHPLQLHASAIATAKKLLVDAPHPPRYDARRVEQDFHDQPFVPIPFPGIAAYYRINNDRLVDLLTARHAAFDRQRNALPAQQ